MSKKGILLCGHGTRVKRGEEAFLNYVHLFAQLVPGCEVEAGFLELSEPDFEEGVKRLVNKGVTSIYALPLFLFTGVHIQRDIPCILFQLQKKYDVSIKLASYIGDCPEMVALSNDLIKRAAKDIEGENADTLLYALGVGASKPEANGDLARLTRMVQESNHFAFALQGFCSRMTYPSVSDALAICESLPYKNIVVVPYIFFPGVYMDKALTLFSEFNDRFPERKVYVTSLLSESKLLSEILLKRLRRVETGEVDLISNLDTEVLESYTPHHHHHGHHHHSHNCKGHHH
ncbi:sirohydrochlorin chelatase [Carboxylicivirga marina]|uniref:sirohydrochlorin chelatase n=1 Tax=Carboxylicivirga marina TaxID=2800988 RepID=UPI0025973AA5|nr:sirohydrochlorin chelatase [uncultured Carboxylicivirga sp.]